MVDLKQIKELSVEERILIVEAIWDSIAEETTENFLTQEQKEELDRRIGLHESGKGKTYTWEEVKAKLNFK
jgi:putative addiction module component (TIGR02574 family)